MCTVNAKNGAMTVREALPDMICGGELYRDDVNKISFVLHAYQAYLDAAAAFPELKAGKPGAAMERPRCSAILGQRTLPKCMRSTCCLRIWAQSVRTPLPSETPMWTSR